RPAGVGHRVGRVAVELLDRHQERHQQRVPLPDRALGEGRGRRRFGSFADRLLATPRHRRAGTSGKKLRENPGTGVATVYTIGYTEVVGWGTGDDGKGRDGGHTREAERQGLRAHGQVRRGRRVMGRDRPRGRDGGLLRYRGGGDRVGPREHRGGRRGGEGEDRA